MIGLGMVGLFAAYGMASYGWVLVKGYNIPFRSWWSPLNPYQWPPAGSPIPTVPQGFLMPTSAAPGATQAASGGGGQNPPAGAPRPPVI
jgi:hypothetical protein